MSISSGGSGIQEKAILERPRIGTFRSEGKETTEGSRTGQTRLPSAQTFYLPIKLYRLISVLVHLRSKVHCPKAFDSHQSDFSIPTSITCELRYHDGHANPKLG